MSSDTSSVVEESKKEDEIDFDKKSVDNKNLLSIKKKKAPMIRLNSKPILAKVISNNNLNVQVFKSLLGEALKK